MPEGNYGGFDFVNPISNDTVDKVAELARLQADYIDLLIQIPLSYQTHGMVELRKRIAELKKDLAEAK